MKTAILALALASSLLACRGEEKPAEGPAPAPTEPAPAPVELQPWGADATPPALAELPAELSNIGIDASGPAAAGVDLPVWKLAVTELGDAPRLLAHRPAPIGRKIRYGFDDVDHDPAAEPVVPSRQMNMTLHWWSLVATDNASQFAFAGLDCEMGKPAGASEIKALSAALAATSKQAKAACMEIRGQARAAGGRIVNLGQSKGKPMTPPVPEILELFTVILPNEKIGVGGSWTATHEVEGMKSTRTYRISAAEGATLTLEFTAKTTFTGKPDEDAKGTMVVSVFDPLAISGSVEVITRLVMPRSKAGDPPREFPIRVTLETLG